MQKESDIHRISPLQCAVISEGSKETSKTEQENPETDKNLFIDGKSLENRMFRSAEEGLYHRYNA